MDGTWPTRPEELGARYGDRWIIYRELRHDGTHGGWVAEPRQDIASQPERIAAADIESLAERLALAATPIDLTGNDDTRPTR